MMFTSFPIQNRAATVRHPNPNGCIYCGSLHYQENHDRKLGEEHVVPESLGGNLVIEIAACKTCEKLINEFEKSVLKTVLYAPRIHLGVRRKKRKRKEDTIKVQGKTGGKDVEITLPIKDIPALLFLLRLGAPGLFVNRPDSIADFKGVWVRNISNFFMPAGLDTLASPILDTHRFSQFLAKIGYCFAVYKVGKKNFHPLILDFILDPLPKSSRYDLIGGTEEDKTSSSNLHELDLEIKEIKSEKYLVAHVSLFTNLGAPTYQVIVGKPL